MTESIVVVGGRAKQVTAFDPATGKVIWSVPTKQRVDSSPVIVGSRVYVAAADGRLAALDLKTGEVRWQFEAGDGFTGSPAVAAGRLVIANDDGVVYCFGKAEE